MGKNIIIDVRTGEEKTEEMESGQKHDSPENSYTQDDIKKIIAKAKADGVI